MNINFCHWPIRALHNCQQRHHLKTFWDILRLIKKFTNDIYKPVVKYFLSELFFILDLDRKCFIVPYYSIVLPKRWRSCDVAHSNTATQWLASVDWTDHWLSVTFFCPRSVNSCPISKILTFLESWQFYLLNSGKIVTPNIVLKRRR